MPDPGLTNADVLVSADEPAPAATPAGGLMSSLPMMVAIFAIFYFLIIRPQQKEAKEHEDLLSGLQKGDEVFTSSGLYGRVWEVQDKVVIVEIADKVRVTMDKKAIKRKTAAGEAVVKGS